MSPNWSIDAAEGAAKAAESAARPYDENRPKHRLAEAGAKIARAICAAILAMRTKLEGFQNAARELGHTLTNIDEGVNANYGDNLIRVREVDTTTRRSSRGFGLMMTTKNAAQMRGSWVAHPRGDKMRSEWNAVE